MAEASFQVNQMKEFILNEAKDKAEEIDAKALQEFTIEKFKIVSQTKDKVRQEYVKKVKAVETDQAIKRSSAINKSRLEKIRSRQDMIGKVAEESKGELVKKLKSEATNKAFIQKLIVQGLLMLLEDEVAVRCRASDTALVSACLAPAAQEYSTVIAKETGAKKMVKLSVDQTKLSPNCLGGVMLSCAGNTITIDNTIDARLELVLEQAKPNIRALLFKS